MGWFGRLRTYLGTFTPRQRRDLVFYIAGNSLLKFAMEPWIGCIFTFGAGKQEVENGDQAASDHMNLFMGLGLGMRCLGTLLAAPLIKRFCMKTVLFLATLAFGLLTTTLLVADGATGGRFQSMLEGAHGPPVYGTFSADFVTAVFCLCCFCSGVMDLVRALIPAEIVEGEVDKLRKMDPLVSSSNLL